MAFIGNTNTTQAFTPAVDYFSGDASTTAFTLSRPVASVAQVQAVISNVPQDPGSAYTVSGNTITFTSAPPSGTNNIYVYYTSPITQVIAPSQGTVTTTSLAANFTLPVANGGTGLTTVPHTITVYTSGSGTYTTPTNCKAILVELIGAGGGAGGGQANYNVGGATGTAGGTTTFGSLTGGGGPGGTVSAIPPAGGAASGGDVNITGGIGGSSVSQSSGAVGNSGGVGFFGGGVGPGGDGQAAPSPAANSGSGGASTGTSGSGVPGGGGSAGGYVRKLINSPSATYSYAVGAGGAAGSTTFNSSSAGAAGIIIVTEFYV